MKKQDIVSTYANTAHPNVEPQTLDGSDYSPSLRSTLERKLGERGGENPNTETFLKRLGKALGVKSSD